MDSFLYTFCKYQIQKRDLLSAFVEEAKSIKSAESMDISEKFSRLLGLSVELNLEVIKTGWKKNRKTINMIKVRMTKLFKDVSTSTNTKPDDIIVLAIVYFHMGVLFSDVTKINKLQFSKDCFMKCLQLLQERQCECKTVIISMRILIELSLLSSKLKNLEKHYFFLNQAMMLYLKYTNEENEYPDPIDVTAALGIEDEGLHPKLLLEELYSIVIEELINIYPSMPKDMHRFVIYFHNLLEKQIEEIIMSRNAESMEWAQTSLTLASYFIQNDRFTEARNHIAAAEYIMDMFCDDIQNQNNPLELQNFYKEMRAQIAKSWGTYGIRLLYFSKHKLSQNEEDNTLHEIDNSKSEFCTKPEGELLEFLIFTDLKKDLGKKYLTDQITDKCVLNYNDAKIVFVNVLRWFNEAKRYYFNTSGNDPIQFASLIMSISFAYKYFAKYEQDKDKQINLCKLQIKILKEALQILNTNEQETLNSNVGVSYYTQIFCELALANSFILNIKTEPLLLNIEQLTKGNSINKIPSEITELVSNNINYFKNALDMFSKF